MATSFQLPPEVLERYFVPYAPTGLPSLYDVPIHSDLGSDQNNSGSIRLLDPLLQAAHRQLAEAFDRVDNARTSPSDNSSENRRLPMSVLCSPHQNSNVAVDAAVRYLGHHLRADVVIVDLIDMVSRSDALEPGLLEAFWQLYQRPKLDEESSESSEEEEDEDEEPDTDESDHSSGRRHFRLHLHPLDTATDETLKAAYEQASSIVRAYLGMGLPQSSDQSASVVSPSLHVELPEADSDREPPALRRRLIYLRDFGAVSKVILPLMPLLLDAITSAPSSIIVAGLSPITRGSPEAASAQLESFFRRLEDKQRWHPRLEAQWRHPETTFMGSKSYLSLDDVFFAAFINRYQKRHFQERRGDLKLAHGVQAPRFKFERLLPVAIVEQLPNALNSAVDEEMARRWRYTNHYRLRRILESKYGHVPGKPGFLDILNSAADDKFDLSAIATRALTWDELESTAQELNLKGHLRNASTFVTEQDQANVMWQQLKTNSITASRAGQAVVDPILSRVKKDRLSSDERVFLEYVVDPTTIRTTFTDVRLKPDIIDALRTAVTLPILFPEAFSTGILAKEPLGGVLLFGPPGTGKTMACRALAKESGARMLHLKASNILACMVGQSEKLITGAFSLARRLAPCVLFIDELDALFSKRTGDSKTWHRSMLTEFMQEMDGLLSADVMVQKRVVVIGATNHPQDLDSALVRRLPRRVMVDLPNLQERRDILEHYLSYEAVDSDISIQKLGARTQLFSGSDLRHLVVTAALAAFKESTSVVWQLQYGPDGLPQPAELQLKPRILSAKHFDQALKQIAACGATNRKELDELRRWEKELFQSEFCS